MKFQYFKFLRKFRKSRRATCCTAFKPKSEKVEESLEEIRSAAIDGKNLMPVLIKAAQNYVTFGEMVEELKKVFGIYEEAAVF